MEERKQEVTARIGDDVSKSAYSSPELTDFGSVETLSLSGTAIGKEAKGVGNIGKRP